MAKGDECFIGQIAQMKRRFLREDVDKWKLLTLDANEVYTFPYPGSEKPLIPGILSEGLISEVISKKLPGTPCVMMQKELLYMQPVYEGDEITVELEIIDVNVERNWLIEKVKCINENGVEVIKGQVVLKRIEAVT